MNKTILVYTILFFTTATAWAQNDFGIDFHGFVKTDVFYDTRQTVDIREGHFLLYPKNELLDNNGEDINANPEFNILSIQSRLTGKIKAPDFLGAKSSGVLEGAFFGHSEGDVNGFRLRHAFVKLDWENTSLLVGQTWNPLFITDMFPNVVSFNTGVPFQPFSRNPQVRVWQRFSDFHVSLAAHTQRDFTSLGPDGGSFKYIRNAAMPTLAMNLDYVTENFHIGVAGEYKTIKPMIYKGVPTIEVIEETLSSTAFEGYMRFNTGDLKVSLLGLMGENMSDLVMLGGYGLKKNIDVDVIEYAPIKTMSGLIDITYGKEFVVGLFGGYTKNMGSDEELNADMVWTRGKDIESVIRVSPRAWYQTGKTRFACEIEYTAAAYGTPNSKFEVENSEMVNNIRILFGAYLFF
ncbi:MAG: hypothetical protein ACLFR2_03250 [Candidatus Kapaibacterium sp.]